VTRAAVRALVRPVLHPRFPARLQRRWLELVTAATRLPPGVTVRTGTLGGRPAEVLELRSAVAGRTVLHLHGGGCTVGPPATHRALAAHLAAPLRGRVRRTTDAVPPAADLGGLPPLVVRVGSEEILLPDAVALACRARSAGVPVDLRRLDGLWHVAHASAGMVTESTTAVREFGAAIAGRPARVRPPPPRAPSHG
jgi:acetyl esterase/lipase